MTPDLSTLTPAQLSAVFAEEVAGWKWVPGTHVGNVAFPDHWEHPNGDFTYPGALKFSTSLDALLPWVEGIEYSLKTRTISNVRVHFCKLEDMPTRTSTVTITRCLCESLILWRRAGKGEKA